VNQQTNTEPVELKEQRALAWSLCTDLTAGNRIFSKLRPEMFTDDASRFIFETALDLYKRGVPMDNIQMEAAMLASDRKKYKQYNGLEVLREQMITLRHTDNVMHYADSVKLRYVRREMVKLFFGAQANSASEEVPVLDVFQKVTKRLNELMSEGVDDIATKHVAELTRVVLEKHTKLANGEYTALSIPSGIFEFDYIMGGFFKSELSVISARPSHGKTAMSVHMAIQVARQGIPVLFFTLEMSEEQMVNRVIASLTDIAPEHLRKKGLNASERQELDAFIREYLVSLPLTIVYMSSPTAEQIRAHTLLAVNNGNCGMVVVDYLHMMRTETKGSDNPVNAVGNNALAMKQLAVDADIPVLLVSQMNRDIDRRVDKERLPVLADLRDSGVIEQVADVVFFVYRSDLNGITHDKETGESLDGVGKLIVMKCRNGSTGTARFRFNRTFTKMSNYKPVKQSWEN